VLEVLSSTRLAVLLTLFLAIVASQVPGTLELAAALGVFRNQGLGNAVPHGLSLCTVAPASNGCPHVVLVGQLQQLQRLSRDHPRGFSLEVIVCRLAVDRDRTGPRRKPNSGHGSLSLPCCVGRG